MTSDWRRTTSSRRMNEPPNGEKPKLLAGRDFLLEVENRQWRMKVAEGIRAYGGEIIDSFDERTPKVVVSDHAMAAKLEKDKGEHKISDRHLKALPALLREAVRRNIKIRTPVTFLSHLEAHASRTKKACSATTSNSTMRGRPTVEKMHSMQPPPRNSQVVQPVVQSVPVRYEAVSRSRHEYRPFLRIDLPGKRPDIRHPDKSSFGPLCSGTDIGYSIFKTADQVLVNKRSEDYSRFLQGQYVAPQKAFKLDERDTICQFCNVTFHGERKEHEKTVEHRNIVRTHGMVPTCERIILNARLRTERLAAGERRRAEQAKERAAIQEASKRATVEYEYGENELRVCWEKLVKADPDEKTPEKRTELSTRRRQKRIRYSPSEGDSPRVST